MSHLLVHIQGVSKMLGHISDEISSYTKTRKKLHIDICPHIIFEVESNSVLKSIFLDFIGGEHVLTGAGSVI